MKLVSESLPVSDADDSLPLRSPPTLLRRDNASLLLLVLLPMLSFSTASMTVSTCEANPDARDPHRVW